MSDLNGMIESAMSNPQFAEIFSSLKKKADSGELDVSSMLGDLTKGTSGGEAPSAPGGAKVSMESHKKLLSALKPYLGDSKRGAVDDILKISEFSGVIEALSKATNNGR